MTFDTVLSIDTATDVVSVALIHRGKEFLLHNNERNKHTEHVLPMVDEILKEASISLDDVDLFAFGAGPGSFTGLRVACGVIQGLAWAKAKPVAPVSNLEACALKIGKEGRVLVSLDARMHECYVGVYEVNAGRILDSLIEPRLMKPDAIGDVIERHGVQYLIGSGFKAYQGEIDTKEVPWTSILHADALDIARHGLVLAKDGKTVQASLASPVYIRNRVALTIEQRQAGECL